MRKTERLFHLVERLRSTKQPITAMTLAQEFEISERTVYRDIKLLASQGLPISGEAGIGYVMAPEFNAPPLQFTHDELELLSIGLRLAFREGDRPMRAAVETAFSKIRSGLKGHIDLDAIDLYAPGAEYYQKGPFLSDARRAIRKRAVLDIEYESLAGEFTSRQIKPLALLFFTEATLIAAYCELRKGFRNFRIDRIGTMQETGENFSPEHFGLRRDLFNEIRRERNIHS
ncbi:MAG: YafY family protein [Pseudomonadota bacterium]